MTKLKGFIKGWNRYHDGTKFFIYKVFGAKCPISIGVRYPELLCDDPGPRWVQSKMLVEEKTDGIMSITTDKEMFKNGIIEIKVASRHTNYDELYFIEILYELGELLEESCKKLDKSVACF